MTTTLPDPGGEPGWNGHAALWKLAQDPVQVAELYKLLGEFCHLVRNRLNSLQLCLYLASRAERTEDRRPWTELDRRYRESVRKVEQVQALCRPIRLSVTPMSLALLFHDREREWSSLLEARQSRLILRPPARDASGQFDPIRLVQALDHLVEWRADAVSRGTEIQLSWWGDGDWLEFLWDESRGQGSRETSKSARATPVESLPLAILARIIAEHGGRLDVETDRKGLRVRSRWPARREEPNASPPPPVPSRS